MEILLNLVLFTVCLFVLVKASDFFIRSGVKIGLFFNLPQFIIGLIIIGIGTSLPELASSISAMLKNSPEIVSANIYGSNIANILVVFGLIAVMHNGLRVDKEFLLGDLRYLLISSFFLIFASIDGMITFWEGILFLIFLVFYIIYALTTTREISDLNHKWQSLFNNILLFFLSLVMLYFSSDYLIKSLINISEIFGIGAEIISGTILAFGTSLPEITVSLQAMKRGNAALVVGNIVGSNIFNIWGIIGLSTLFGSVIVPVKFFHIAVPFVLGSIFLYWLFAKNEKINKFEGWVFLAAYAFFLMRVIELI